MKKRNSKPVVEWEVDPAGQWVSKREALDRGAGFRTVIYRPSATGSVASWWDTRSVDTRGTRTRGFDIATPVFEPLARAFSSILDEARAAAPVRPAPAPMLTAEIEPVLPPAQIPPALAYLSNRP